MLSATRDMDAAQRFFRSAQSMVNSIPTQVTTDGHDSYPRAIRETLGPKRPDRPDLARAEKRQSKQSCSAFWGEVAPQRRHGARRLALLQTFEGRLAPKTEQEVLV